MGLIKALEHAGLTVTGLPRSMALACIARPTALEPVNVMASTASCVVSTAPISEPLPMARFSTPAGSPASISACSECTAVRGTISAGFHTTVFP